MPLCAQDVRLNEVLGEAHVAVLVMNVDQVLNHGVDVVDHVLGNPVILSPRDTRWGS